MRYYLMALTIVLFSSCMKSKDEYQEAISDVQAERQEEMLREVQREEEAPMDNPERARGSNDAEGMGMDE